MARRIGISHFLAALRIKWRGYPRSVNADKARRDKVIEIMKARREKRVAPSETKNAPMAVSCRGEQRENKQG